MGRNIPLGGEVHPNIHYSLVYFSFMIACFSATIAIFSSLCGSLSKKKSSPPAPSNNNRENNNENPLVHHVNTTTSPKETSPRYDVSFKRSSNDQQESSTLDQLQDTLLQQPLPPPPAMRASTSSINYNNSHLRANSMVPTVHSRSNSTSSQGKLSTSVSMNKLFGSSLGSRQSSRRDQESSYIDKKRDKKLKDNEDSIWKKQIILGEKCRVPMDEDDDTILYDENGNRISTYHPKTPNIALTISRQTSNIEEDAIPK